MALVNRRLCKNFVPEYAEFDLEASISKSHGMLAPSKETTVFAGPVRPHAMELENELNASAV